MIPPFFWLNSECLYIHVVLLFQLLHPLKLTWLRFILIILHSCYALLDFFLYLQGELVWFNVVVIFSSLESKTNDTGTEDEGGLG